MSTVSATSSASDIFASINATNSASSTAKTSSTQEAQDTFLKLLVTQLKNQDPLNPMDNAEMTSQLAQMSTVSGIDKLNTTLSSLVDSAGTSQSLQAAAMIGKNVLVPGSQLALSNGAAYAGINLSGAADQVTLTILDSSGNVVQTETLGAQKAGVLDIAWDGTNNAGVKVADGTYKFSVNATQGSNAVTVNPLQVGTVSALVRSGSGFLLDLGTLGTFNFTDVQQIL
jgi:flagellar basal-body rod modification protein FlgD